MLWKFKVRRNNHEALLYREDMKRRGLGFFKTLIKHREYINVLYHRLGDCSLPFILLCGKYPYAINNQAHMKLGGGVLPVHPDNSHINARSVGRNFWFFQNVTVGNYRGGIPVIGDNVTLSTGAIVIGDIKVGNNVNVGAACVVTKDVPDNCTVIGNPAVIVKLNGEKVNIPLDEYHRQSS